MAKEKENLVKVVILMHVMNWIPGTTAEVTAEEAEALCKVNSKNDGHKVVQYQKAMRVEDFEKMKAQPVNKGGLTQGELTELGLKNTVATPTDPAFEKRLKNIQEGKIKPPAGPLTAVEPSGEVTKPAKAARAPRKAKKAKAGAAAPAASVPGEDASEGDENQEAASA